MTALRAAAVALLTLLLAAGCLGGGDGGDPRPSPSPTSSASGGPTSSSTTSSAPPPGPVQTLDLLLSFAFVGCEGLAVQVNRPLGDVQALLPDGFAAAPAPDAPSGAPFGALVVELLRCGSLSTPTASVPDTYIGLEWAYIQRPADRVPQAPDAPVQQYLFRMLAGEDVLAQLWPAAGYDTHAGAANYTVLVEDPPQSRVSFGSVGADYLVTASGGQLDAAAGSRTQAFARYTVLGDGSILLWTGTDALPVVAAGPGSAEVADDDPFVRYATPVTPGIPGTPVQSRPTLTGVGRQVADGDVAGQDLRRLFP